MGAVRYFVNELERQRPDARIILGGPQVIGHGDKYLKPHIQNTYICNGEGETIFLNFLRAVQAGSDFGNIPGLTYCRDGGCLTTLAPPLIKNINDIPSPFLSNLFADSRYTMSIFETNRGCPYQCTFCYWGRGDDLTVRKFDPERVKQELEWISKANVMMLFIADANWGLLARDVELSEHIVACHEKYGTPTIVSFSAAKDKVKRSASIAKLFTEAQIITSQAIGIQSMSEQVLQKIRRRNIKLEVLEETRKELEESGVTTFTELVWPLPGETLESFKNSLNLLCHCGVSTVVVYPCLLLHTTAMEKQQAELGLRTASTLNEDDELELVIETKDVSAADYETGMWTVLALYCLYNIRTLRHVGKYLNDHNLAQWASLFAAFGEYCRSSNSRIFSYWKDMLAARRQSEFAVLGRVVHDILHEYREDYSELLCNFVVEQDWWGVEDIQVLFEIDVINTPYVYSNTPFQITGHDDNHRQYGWRYLKLSSSSERSVSVSVPPDKMDFVAKSIFGPQTTGNEHYKVDHARQQYPFMQVKTPEQNAAYCYGMIQRAQVIMPNWSPSTESSSSTRLGLNTCNADTPATSRIAEAQCGDRNMQISPQTEECKM
jgi:hypothetical protein